MASGDGAALHLSLKRDTAELARLTAAVDAFLEARPHLGAAAYPLQLALEELVSNVIRHADAVGVPLDIEVSVQLQADGLAVRIEDDGPAFDPLAVPAPDVDAPMDQRVIGGLGIHLVRHVSTDLAYARAGERNRLTLRIPLPG